MCKKLLQLNSRIRHGALPIIKGVGYALIGSEVDGLGVVEIVMGSANSVVNIVSVWEFSWLVAS
jgi:hypothetical protein